MELFIKLHTCLAVRYASFKKQKGAALVEYALILALVSIAAASTLGTLGTNIDLLFQAVDSEITTATP